VQLADIPAMFVLGLTIMWPLRTYDEHISECSMLNNRDVENSTAIKASKETSKVAFTRLTSI